MMGGRFPESEVIRESKQPRGASVLLEKPQSNTNPRGRWEPDSNMGLFNHSSPGINNYLTQDSPGGHDMNPQYFNGGNSDPSFHQRDFVRQEQVQPRNMNGVNGSPVLRTGIIPMEDIQYPGSPGQLSIEYLLDSTKYTGERIL